MGRSESESREVFAGVSLDANTPSSSKLSVKSFNHCSKSRNQFLRAGRMSLLLFFFLWFL